jgi:hypothetical protein
LPILIFAAKVCPRTRAVRPTATVSNFLVSIDFEVETIAQEWRHLHAFGKYQGNTKQTNGSFTTKLLSKFNGKCIIGNGKFGKIFTLVLS